MTPTVLRRAALATFMVLALAVAAGGCHVHSDGPSHHAFDIIFAVENVSGETIIIEGVDEFGFAVEFGYVFPGETVDFVVSDFWIGRRLIARYAADGVVIESEFAFDGLYWLVF